MNNELKERGLKLMDANTEEHCQPGPIVQRLCEAILATGINQCDIRKKIRKHTGVSKQNLTHWFNGTTRSPSTDHLVALSDEYQIDLTWLLTGRKQEDKKVSIDKFKKNAPVNIGHAETVNVHSHHD